MTEMTENKKNKNPIKLVKAYITEKLFEALQGEHVRCMAMYGNTFNNKILDLPKRFLPNLCAYQKRTICWLLYREKYSDIYPSFFCSIEANDNETILYKHKYSFELSTIMPQSIKLPPGGILAEEMGLGKTVEILALILLNSRPSSDLCLLSISKEFEKANAKRKRINTKCVFCICMSKSSEGTIKCLKCDFWQHKKCVTKYEYCNANAFNNSSDNVYICPACWNDYIKDSKTLIPTKATLIVTPITIRMQWLSEINAHTQPPLRVFLYEGAISGKWISPLELAEYDIVLTHYGALKNEVYFAPENVCERVTRNQPLKMRIHSPLLMMEWWRVCLDEAQMVESNTSKVAMLVRRLPAINRWAVTGTPIQRSLNDLHPLLKFIDFKEPTDKSTWNSLINDFLNKFTVDFDVNSDDCEESPPELIKILQKCMWGTNKSQIKDELRLPPQEEIVHRIDFSDLEKLFYREQHDEHRSKFLANVAKYKNHQKTISPQIMNMILQPFSNIRLSCTLPVVMINSNSITTQQKQFLQREDLHKYLKTTNEINCKTELRNIASCHNGLAGLYYLKNMYNNALRHYKSVLNLAKTYKELNVTVDSLLQIHALHNIMQIMLINGDKDNESSTFQEIFKSYEEQYSSLESKYLNNYVQTMLNNRTAYMNCLNAMDEYINRNYLPFLSEQLNILTAADELLLLQKIYDECLPRFTNKYVTLSTLQSKLSLLYIIQSWFTDVSKDLKHVIKAFKDLDYFCVNVHSRRQVNPNIWNNIQQLVESVNDCHLNKTRDVSGHEFQYKTSKKNKCIMCQIHKGIIKFENQVFDRTKMIEGLDIPSFEFYLNKIVLNFLKCHNHDDNAFIMLNRIKRYFEQLFSMPKYSIKFWIEIEFTIKAFDELNMCKMRISLTDKIKEKTHYKIMKNEIEERLQNQLSDISNAEHQFANKLARLKYIKHLENEKDQDICPICQQNDAERYAVLECGHQICIICLKKICKYTDNTNFRCPVCRQSQSSKTIYHICRSNNIIRDKSKIVGNYTSKITYMLYQIFHLQKEHEELMATIENKWSLKILIFSKWESILLAIASALKENSITYRVHCTAKNIEEFKNPLLGINCLLMPFHKGSKGLNLIEATHVFLMEPILNLGEELQAIGRVHRFGQTRPITVHRFIINNTIEENIFNFLHSSRESKNDYRSELDNMSLEAFEKLFILNSTDIENVF